MERKEKEQRREDQSSKGKVRVKASNACIVVRKKGDAGQRVELACCFLL